MQRILDHTPTVRTAVQKLLEDRMTAVPESAPLQADALKRLVPFATGGKLLRGSLICFGYEAFSEGKITPSVMKTAVAMELIHSGLLIHDDIMDNDALRRGWPSMHEQYRQRAAKEKLADAGHFGLSMAMTVGDIGLFLAFELIGTIDTAPAVKNTLISLCWQQLQITCAGQMQDLHLEAQADEPSKQTLYNLMEAKTASYTVALPLIMGAVLAGQPPQTLEKLRSFGTSAGLIFQIRDDELGVMGDSGSTGKPVDSDIREGKKTLLRHYLLDRCSPDERIKLQVIFGNPKASVTDIGYVRRLVQTHGVDRLLNDDVADLSARASKVLTQLRLPAAATKELEWLVAFCAQRNA